ncbi:MAG TPA: HAMP domain-containing sensor histidine kinase [Burkholderiaceae bacterium]|nr:HAMP domain-containing sensor histidine kinase [Burkholderiaceae bacterium]
MSAGEHIGRPDLEAVLRRLAELEAELAEARRAVRARDDFLAIAAHELRTPMNALGLQVASIERQARRAGDAELAERIGRTRRTVRHYVARATLLLDVTRLNTGHLPMQLRPVDLAALVAEVVAEHEDEAAFHGATLAARVPPELIGRWDAEVVERILANLVSNALKYGDGSPVTVSASLDGADRVALSVRDEGPGIDEAQRRLVFEKFERVVDGSQVRSGFGLGLWIVGQLVEALRGSITVRTAPGAGCEFIVVLPLDPGRTDDHETGAQR